MRLKAGSRGARFQVTCFFAPLRLGYVGGMERGNQKIYGGLFMVIAFGYAILSLHASARRGYWMLPGVPP